MMIKPKTARPYRKRLRLEDLCPDGVDIVVDWDRMMPGSSAFVPCLDSDELTRQVLEIAYSRGWRMAFYHRIEGGKWGVRFWRLT
jgi:hypothetical protein